MTELSDVPVRRIIAAIADACARWSDADFPPRVRLLDRIVERTGYTLPVVEYALDQIFFSVTHESLAAAIAGELGSVDCLDEMHDGRTAVPAGSAAVISSRTTIGVAIVPAIFALCAKCDVTVKDREDGLVRAFFATLGEELAEFNAAARAQAWSGESDEVDLDAFDCVAAFGSDTTLHAIRARLRTGARFAAYGSKASAGYVSRAALSDATIARRLAHNAARDVVLYDTEGCMSMHLAFVERGAAVTPREFAALLAAGIERSAVEFPPGAADVHARARVAGLRDLGAFRATGGNGAVFSDRAATFLVSYDPPVTEPPPFAPRSVALLPVDGLEQAHAYLHAHDLRLEAVATSSADAAIVALARDSGASRICAFGELQRPPLAHRHGGIGRITPFISWIASD